MTLFTTWHAQHNPAVAAAAEALAGKRIAAMRHHLARGRPQMASRPALDLGAGRVRRVRSRHQRLLDRDARSSPAPCSCERPTLHFPANAQTPIAAEIDFASPAADGPLSCSLDWRRSEGEEWTIAVRTTDGLEVRLERRRLAAGDRRRAARAPTARRISDIYAAFVDLIDGRSSVDLAPLRLSPTLPARAADAGGAFEDWRRG